MGWERASDNVSCGGGCLVGMMVVGDTNAREKIEEYTQLQVIRIIVGKGNYYVARMFLLSCDYAFIIFCSQFFFIIVRLLLFYYLFN